MHACYNFALVLHENALVFSQSEARNFFMYILLRQHVLYPGLPRLSVEIVNWRWIKSHIANSVLQYFIYNISFIRYTFMKTFSENKGISTEKS